MKKVIVLFASLLFSSQNNAQQLATRVIVDSLDTPWEVLWGPDHFIWVTERYGRISRVNPNTGELVPLITIDEVAEGSERGMMGMVVLPTPIEQFNVYVAYTYIKNNLTFVKVVRYPYDPIQQKISGLPKTILDSIPGNANHDGCRLFFYDDHLFITTGDAQDGNQAQDNNSLAGKLLRLNPDGTTPEDNPIPGNLLWSKGHRNAQGLVFVKNESTNETIIYSSEHGPNNDDELNIVRKAGNYGWPAVAGYCDDVSEVQFCIDSNVVEPIRAWTPTLAVCGIDYYPNLVMIPEEPHPTSPDFGHSILMVTLKEKDLRCLRLNTNGDSIISEKVFFDNQFGRLRDVCVSPVSKGSRLFIATSNKDGRGTSVTDDDRIIEIYNSELTSVNEKEKSFFSIYPNPAYADGTLTIACGNFEAYKVSLFNSLGEEVFTKNFSGPQYSLPVPQFPQGLYVIKVSSETRSRTGKLVITE